MIGLTKVWGVKRECRESFEKKVNSLKKWGSDETVTEVRDFERFNVNLRSAKNVKWWPCDWATCQEIKA